MRNRFEKNPQLMLQFTHEYTVNVSSSPEDDGDDDDDDNDDDDATQTLLIRCNPSTFFRCRKQNRCAD